MRPLIIAHILENCSDIKDLVIKWKPTGLLHYLNKDKQRELAKILERTLTFDFIEVGDTINREVLIENYIENKDYIDISHIFIPSIVRIHRTLSDNRIKCSKLDIKSIYRFLYYNSKKINIFTNALKNTMGHNYMLGTDVYAEFVAFLCDKFSYEHLGARRCIPKYFIYLNKNYENKH